MCILRLLDSVTDTEHYQRNDGIAILALNIVNKVNGRNFKITVECQYDLDSTTRIHMT
jgi:hypothetical protein